MMRHAVTVTLAVVALTLALIFVTTNAEVQFGSNRFYSKWCRANLFFPKSCQKKFPSNTQRELACPIVYDAVPKGYALDGPLSKVKVYSGLRAIPSARKVDMVVILIRRTADGVYYKYLSNGRKLVPLETWSSSKVFAVAAAAGVIRRSCKVGLEAMVKGPRGGIPLGDLVTIIASYDTSKGYTSNGLAKYFGQIATSALKNLVQNKLGKKSETLGGSYGVPAPAIGHSYSTSPNRKWCALKSQIGLGGANTISVLTSAELVKRIVMHREIKPNNRIPGFLWSDAQAILYGAVNSKLFQGLKWGGMSTDISALIQSKLDMNSIEKRSKGKWRIFDKVGWGYSSSRRGDVRQNGYGCFPVVDANGAAKPNSGVEFVIATRGSLNGDASTLTKARVLAQEAVGDVVKAIVSGKIK
jgi:hypothetical protein